MDILPLRNPLRGQQVSYLTEKLREDDSNIRYQAAQALGEHGEKASVALKELIDALEDSDPKVRYFAAQAIGNVASEPTLVLPKLIQSISLEPDLSTTSVSYAAFRSLVKLGKNFPEEVIPHLICELDTSKPNFNQRIHDCLIKIGEKYERKLNKYLERASRSKNESLNKNARELLSIIEKINSSKHLVNY